MTLPFWLYAFFAPFAYPVIALYIANGNWILGIIVSFVSRLSVHCKVVSLILTESAVFLLFFLLYLLGFFSLTAYNTFEVTLGRSFHGFPPWSSYQYVCSCGSCDTESGPQHHHQKHLHCWHGSCRRLPDKSGKVKILSR